MYASLYKHIIYYTYLYNKSDVYMIQDYIEHPFLYFY